VRLYRQRCLDLQELGTVARLLCVPALPGLNHDRRLGPLLLQCGLERRIQTLEKVHAPAMAAPHPLDHTRCHTSPR
jgi:hypothetical protein